MEIMPAGYSSNPLYKKLGMKSGMQVRLINPPENYASLIGDMFSEINISKIVKDIECIHWFTNSEEEYRKLLPVFMKQIRTNGMIWVSWHKKSKMHKSELNENLIRDVALSLGLVDVKVCAVDESWSGLKLVYRLANRK